MFRTQCSLDDRVGMYSTLSGEVEMCIEHYKGEDKMPSELRHPIQGRMLVNVPSAPCQQDEACSAYQMGFCGGGPQTSSGKLLRVPDYCSSSQHYCTCMAAIQPCGTKGYFTFGFKPKEVLSRCEGDDCEETISIEIPYWPVMRMGLLSGGCQQVQKCTLENVQIWIEHECEERNLFSPLDPSATIWRELQHELDVIPDVSFGFFWPSTISESVSRTGSAAKTLFFGFMLCASLCLLASGYTTQMKTVDLPSLVIPIIGVEFNTMRSWFPPIGLILLSAVPMVPASQMHDFPGVLLTSVHLVGAQFCFVVYLVCEGMALIDRENAREMRENNRSEWCVRFGLFLTGSIAMLLFVNSWAFLAVFGGGETTPYLGTFPDWGYSDFYKTIHTGETFLLRPAEGTWQTLKMISYAAELIVSLSILSSMLMIWFFNHRLPVDKPQLHARTVMCRGKSDPEYQDS
ncbi:unnamed protein product [Prorocentrum cordatum]|uniref:Uncharacterized protein n=1 Tax=Prorocentrum cordatum TaxID=2364126 RepID=A0ABN9Y7B5_9DINO|nr:unnamed protein product [Polarella glacialis]